MAADKTNIRKRITTHEDLIIKFYEKVDNYRKDIKSNPENDLEIIHNFLRIALCLVTKLIDNIIREKISDIEIGYSINYYPKYEEGPLKGRVSVEQSDGTEIRTFVFTNNNINPISYVFDSNKLDEENFQSVFNELFENYLVAEHYYIDLLNIFYELSNFFDKKEISPRLFSIKEYFYKTADSAQVVFNANFHSKDLKEEFCAEYNCVDYDNFLEFANSGTTKFNNTEVQGFWDDHAKNITTLLESDKRIKPYIQYCLSANNQFTKESRGNLVFYCNKDINEVSYPGLIEEVKFVTDYFLTKLSELEHNFVNSYNLARIREAQLKTAFITILVDSFAHNISAHSLAALKWWFELRNNMLTKRFRITPDITLDHLLPSNINISSEVHGIISENYYSTLGQKNGTFNKDFYSLFDFLQFANVDEVLELLSWKPLQRINDETEFFARFPVPLDYAIFPFVRFLRDKGAFWSGVTRDENYGGETKTWFNVLWEDFANNPFYLGTIAKSEGITKLNIYLSVKHRDETGNLICTEGRFVTIDMSIIEYESDIAESPTLSLQDNNKYDFDNKLIKSNSVEQLEIKNGNNLCSKELSDDEIVQCDQYVENNEYSKYAFVKLGENFAKFREILSNEENFSVFLPGGIVGEHALFTIFENTLRNIKHYNDNLSDIQQKGIDFWISIEEKHLTNFEQNDCQLFQVGVWLCHSTELVKIKKMKDGTYKPSYLLFTITAQTLKPIIDELTGAPRMGGNSQDKACAAMLFNNKFATVERRGEKKRDEEYYPWIRYSTKCKDIEEFTELIEVNTKDYISQLEQLKEKYSENYLDSDGKGLLKKYFYLWKGKDVLGENSLGSDEWENPARSKFIIGEKENDEYKIKARMNGAIRVIESSNVNENSLVLYKKWVDKWILNNQNHSIEFKQDISTRLRLQFENGMLGFSKHGTSDQNSKFLYLIHGDEKSYNCHVRSHGAFWTKFFNDIPDKQPAKFAKYKEKVLAKLTEEEYKKKMLLSYELWETILTRIVIFDERIYSRIPKSYRELKKTATKVEKEMDSTHVSKELMLNKQLSLNIFDEDLDKFESRINSFGANINFLVIHLSFIEQMKNREGVKYSEETISKFIEEKLEPLFIKNGEIKDNFIFVITSGRGRDKWRESLKEQYSIFKKFTIFKPVESLLTAIEQGVSNNDHFDIKYNLVKVLFGN
jgi:hypothetical protein